MKRWRRALWGIVGAFWALGVHAFPIAPYFPLDDNATWGYRIDLGPADAVTRTVLPGTTTVNSVPAKTIAYSSGVIEHYTNDPSEGIRLHRIFAPPQFFGTHCGLLSKTDTLSLPFIHSPSDVPSFPAATGTQSGSVNRVLAPEGPCPPPGAVFTYSGSSTVQGFEVVTVPLGSFQTVRIVSDLTITFVEVSQIVYARTQTLWLASGIGVVKEARTESSEFSTLSETLELTSTNVVRTTADTISFTPATGAAPGSAVSSNIVTITGITAAASVSVTAGTVRINGGAPVSSGTVTNGQTLQVVVTAPGFNATTVANVTVGGVTVPFSVSSAKRARGDYDGNLKSDIFWKYESTGTTFVWKMNGTMIAGTGSPATVGGPGAGWSVQGIGDFNGDGRSDVLWRNSVSGAVVVWLMNVDGTSILGTGSPATVTDTNWVVQGVGDFNGDGRADVLWKHATTGTVLIWLMQTGGTTIMSTGSPATVGAEAGGWSVQGVGDFNGDGKSDILWRNAASGTVLVWLMNGLAVSGTGSPATVTDANWQVQGVADFNGDGRADILWKYATNGVTYVWLMNPNGTSIASTGSPATVGGPGGWEVKGVGDYDGDGKADVFWKHLSAGTTLVWLMNGAAISSSGSPATVGADPNWQVQNPR